MAAFDNDYRLFGSPVLGGILAFLVDPVNEFTGLWLGNPARRIAHEKTKRLDGSGISLTPTIMDRYKGFSLVGYFLSHHYKIFALCINLGT